VVVSASTASTPAIGADQFQALTEEAWTGQHGGIDWAGHRGFAGKQGPERLLGVPGQAGDLQARVVARVGGKHRGAAGVRYHGDPGPGGRRLRGQQDRGVEQLAEVRGGDHPGLLEQGLPW